MAESEGAGLDILIKQRISRPSFTRMISWEIEKVSNCPPKRHRTSSRQKKADQSQAPDRLEENASKEEDGGGLESEGDSNDSEDSEYFSAEENVPCTGQDESDDKDGTNPNEMEAVLEQAGNLLSAQLTNIYLGTISQHNRKAPSKKQKKKRRRQQLYHGVEHYAEFLAPFRNVENINFGVEELRGDLLSKSTDTVAEVPTLFELCIRTIWRKNQQTITGFELLPGLIKHSVSSWGQRRAFTSMQLSCLYRVLAVVEKEIKGFPNVFWFPTRNVWSLGYLDPPGPPSPVHIVGNEVSAVIPYTYASCGYCDFFNSGFCRQRTSQNYLFPLYTLSLLVNVLDLMIPTHLHTKKGKEALTGEETDQAITAAVSTTLTHLKTRYPDVIKLCQDRALPYIYWLRGHNRLALDEFLRLAESAPSCKEKNYHLLEAARLCRLQNQEDAARKLYREVQDQLIVLPGVWGIENVKSEIVLQTLMLCANTYDQGLMSKHKAVASLKAWRLLNNVPARLEQAESFFPAVDALLCYHLAHLPGKTAAEKLSVVVDFLKIAATKCADLRLHLSLVYAWMGQQPDSIMAYQGSLFTVVVK